MVDPMQAPWATIALGLPAVALLTGDPGAVVHPVARAVVVRRVEGRTAVAAPRVALPAAAAPVGVEVLRVSGVVLVEPARRILPGSPDLNHPSPATQSGYPLGWHP